MDEIDRELASALSIEASPEFRARVRERIAREPAPLTWYLQWRVAGACAAALVVLTIAVALTIARVDKRSSPLSIAHGPREAAPSVAASSVVDVPSSGPAVPLSEPARHRPSRRQRGPEVLMAASEARGLRALLAVVRERRVAFVFDNGSYAAQEPVNEIVIAPISIEPVGSEPELTNSEGDGQ